MMRKIKSRWEDFLEEHPQLQDSVAFVQSLFPPLNFITIHYAYFIISCAVFSGIFYGSNSSQNSIAYIDCLFLVVSAMTDTGLNTVNLSTLTTWQQVLMFLLFIFGSAIWVSFGTVTIRKHAFEKRFDHIVEAEREDRKRRRAIAAESQTGPSIRQFFSFEKSTSNTGHPLRQFFTFDKFKSSPPETTTLPGLGTRQPAMTEMDEVTKQRSNRYSLPLRRIASAPEEDIPSDVDEANGTNNVSRTTTLASEAAPSPPRDHISFMEQLPQPQNSGAGATSAYSPGNLLPQRINVRRPSTIESGSSEESEGFIPHWKRILTKGNTSKRGQFYDLTSDEREALGGCEYRALKVLSIAVPAYGFVWQFFGAIALATWMHKNAANRALQNGQNPIWTGIFLSVSAFNNAGMSLLDANMTAFQADYFPLFVVAMLVLAGNTAYPLFLRLFFWTTLKVQQYFLAPDRGAHWRETFEFILKYPRRVYTTLFNSRATWWLVGVLFATNIIDWVAFEVLNIGNPVTEAMSISDRIMAGWFQAIAVRAAGFAVVSISGLYPGVQLLYMIMMYISVFPVSITMRHSNVYEERSLGIYEKDPSALDPENGETTDFLMSPETASTNRTRLRRVATGATTAVGKTVNKGLKHAMTFHGVGARRPPKGVDDNSRISFISQQIRGQLAHDLWWLVLPLLFIIIIETDHFLEQPIHYAIFNVFIEVVSAYGNVGLSVGVPTDSFSFAGSWHTGSKLLLCLVMLRGRHRGLPVALDKAVRLPGEKLHDEEEEDQMIRKTITIEGSQRGMSRDMTRED